MEKIWWYLAGINWLAVVGCLLIGGSVWAVAGIPGVIGYVGALFVVAALMARDSEED